MFKKADELLKDRGKLFSEREVHVVSFRWLDLSPVLEVYEDGDVFELDLGRLDMNVSKEKICVGSFKDGYTPCPEEKNVSTFNQCRSCALSWIPKLECVFEPRDCGNCSSEFCEDEHSVYLAFHGKYPKVGMTRKERLKQRMIEQGADAYAILSTLDHRTKAREEERSLSELLGISQRISGKKILEQMGKKLDRSMVLTAYRGVKNRVPVGEMRFVKGYPITEPLRNVPRLRPTAGIHRGKMVGIKGRFLIYESSGLQALDLADLPGRKMRVRT